MIVLIVLLAAVALGVYCSYVERCRRQWQGAQRHSTTAAHDLSNLTVVVALHNEQHNVGRLTASLQSLPRAVKIILVCDHCTDRSQQLLSQAMEGDERCCIVDNTGERGKKHAQRLGAEMANTQWVLFTDADCCAGPSWCDAMMSVASDEVSMVIGPVAMKGNGSRLTHLFELEFLSMQVVTAGKAVAHNAVMCNGANLMVSRESYLVADTNTRYASGDDMFLLSSLKQRGSAIAYCTCADSLITTPTPFSLSSFVRQRTRWLRKSTGYTDTALIGCAQVVFWGNMVWPLLLVVALCEALPVWAAVAAFAVKTLTDYRLLRAGRDFWRIDVDLLSVIALAVAYPSYVLAIAVLTFFRSRHKW